LNYLKKKLEPPVTVDVPGGKLRIDFDRNLKEIYLSGRVQLIYVGQLKIEKNEWMNFKQLEKSFHTQKK